jgi:GNAT superfamily N-acetyltransferase
MNWSVESLTLADARRLDTLWRERYALEGLAPAEVDAAVQFVAHRLVDFDEDRRRGRWVLLGASDEAHRLAGFLSASLIPRLDLLTGHIYLDQVYVLPEHRRQGVGRALIAALLEIARRRAAARVTVSLDLEVPGLAELIQACGFAVDVIGWGVYELEPRPDSTKRR